MGGSVPSPRNFPAITTKERLHGSKCFANASSARRIYSQESEDNYATAQRAQAAGKCMRQRGLAAAGPVNPPQRSG